MFNCLVFAAVIARARCLIIGVSAVICFGAFSLPMANPQSAIRNPLFHKVHVSVAQLEFNQKTQSVEMVLRVYTDDLESALSQQTKREIKIDPEAANKDKKVGEMVLAYLRNNLELKTKSGNLMRLNWVGLEWQVNMFWLYVQAKMPVNAAKLESLDGSQLRNRIFCELFEDQVNIVNTKIQNKQVGLMFESKDGFKLISTTVPAKK